MITKNQARAMVKDDPEKAVNVLMAAMRFTDNLPTRMDKEELLVKALGNPGMRRLCKLSEAIYGKE